MAKLREWWKGGISPWVKFVYLILLLNAVPAFLILMSIPQGTAQWFVWTVNPPASARLLGAMYGDAVLMVGWSLLQTRWARVRITMVVVALFSVAATVVTFVHLDPFLKHPWFHLAYWLTMYVILVFAAPYVFWREERAHGARLPVDVPLSPAGRAMAAFGLLACGVTGLGLLISPEFVTQVWPWTLTPLVGRLLGVWFSTLAFAYAWALWDGDRRRTAPIFWQAIPTGLLVALVPLLHGGDLQANAAPRLALYLGLALLAVAGGLVAVVGKQGVRVAGAPGARR